MLMERRRHHACLEEQVWELGHHLDSQKLVNRFLGVLEASWFFTENRKHHILPLYLELHARKIHFVTNALIELIKTKAYRQSSLQRAAAYS